MKNQGIVVLPVMRKTGGKMAKNARHAEIFYRKHGQGIAQKNAREITGIKTTTTLTKNNA